MNSREPEEAPEKTYFAAIEEEFVRLRGAPLLLSPADWHLVSTWYAQGIPLAVVLAAVREVMATAASRGRRKPVLSLSYCRHEVEAEFGRYLEATTGDGSRTPEGRRPSLPQRLEKKAVRLERLGQAQPETAVPVEQAVAALRQAARDLQEDSSAPERVESHLASCERSLLDRLQALLPAAEWEAMRQGCRLRLEPHRQRMAGTAYAATLRHACDVALRRHFKLPRLSLLSD